MRGLGAPLAAGVIFAPFTAAACRVNLPVNYSPIAIGMIGPRGFGAFCTSAYQDIGLARVVAFAGREAANLAALAATYSVPRTYTDWRELVQDPGVELVHIVTPPDKHAEMAVAALRAGKHVFVEKPLATSNADAQAILRAARDVGKVAGINFVMRYNPLYQVVQTIAQEGWLGPLTHIGFENYASDEGLGDDHWFWNPVASGGIFVEHGVHFFDIIGAIAGSPAKTVLGHTWTRNDGTGKEDRVQALVTYANGVEASYYHAFNRPGALERQTAHFAFERGHVNLMGWIPNRLGLNAVVDDAGLAGLKSILRVRIDQDAGFSVGDRTIRGNGNDYAVSARVGATKYLDVPTPVYRTAVQDALADLIASIRDPVAQAPGDSQRRGSQPARGAGGKRIRRRPGKQSTSERGIIPMTQQYDAVIIGAGQSGDPLARALAKAGRRVALIEREAVGGTCVNRGCTPTKTMVASARVAYLARRAGDYGVHVGPVTVDLAQVRQRKQDIVEDFRGGTEKKIQKIDGLDLIYGEAGLTSPQSVEVALKDGGIQTLAAAQIFLNAGARPLIPKLPGLDTVPFLDSTSVMELDAVPEHLIVLGGSYIALEFGQMFRRFGSRVTIIEQAPHLLGREDPDVAEAMTNILREDGLEIYLAAKALRVAKTTEGVSLTVATAAGEMAVTGSHLLLAVGRTPNTDTLGLDKAGVKTDDKGYIQTNERLETNVPGIWALGDVKGGPAFTHISYDDFRILQANLLEGGQRTTTDRPVPYTVFTDPQLGRVGMTETEAAQAGWNIRVAKLPMSQVARAIETDETRGFMKAIVDAETKQILGCAILGLEGGEIMAVLEVAMLGKLPYPILRDAVLAHPTLAESLNNLFLTLD